MKFEWDENKAARNLSKHGVPFMEDELWSEYDLKSLRVRRLGPGRKSFAGTTIRLEPDVAEVFPDADAVNEALRFLIRVVQKISFLSSECSVANQWSPKTTGEE